MIIEIYTAYMACVDNILRTEAKLVSPDTRIDDSVRHLKYLLPDDEQYQAWVAWISGAVGCSLISSYRVWRA